MIPNILWSQNTEYIYIKIIISNVNGLNLDFNNNKFIFIGYSNDTKYNLNVEFYKKIDSNINLHSYKIFETYIDCKIKKNTQENWDYLIQNQSFYKNHIKTDWDKINTENLMELTDNQKTCKNIYIKNNEIINKPKIYKQNENLNQLTINPNIIENTLDNSSDDELEI